MHTGSACTQGQHACSLSPTVPTAAPHGVQYGPCTDRPSHRQALAQTGPRTDRPSHRQALAQTGPRTFRFPVPDRATASRHLTLQGALALLSLGAPLWHFSRPPPQHLLGEALLAAPNQLASASPQTATVGASRVTINTATVHSQPHRANEKLSVVA